MLTAFFVASPFAIAALFAFAKFADGRTGSTERDL
jgi:hypothetical protein